jgi:hypothetical protein
MRQVNSAAYLLRKLRQKKPRNTQLLHAGRAARNNALACQPCRGERGASYPRRAARVKVHVSINRSRRPTRGR